MDTHDIHSMQPVCRHFNRVVRYMKFAAASYGWKYHIKHTQYRALPSLLLNCKYDFTAYTCMITWHYVGITNMCFRWAIMCWCIYTYRSQCCKGRREGDEESGRPLLVPGDRCGWQLRSLLKIAKIEEKDVIYASFTSEVSLHYYKYARKQYRRKL